MLNIEGAKYILIQYNMRERALLKMYSNVNLSPLKNTARERPIC